jgi:hypothetical protein
MVTITTTNPNSTEKKKKRTTKLLHAATAPFPNYILDGFGEWWIQWSLEWNIIFR